MATFTDSIKILIDVVSGNASKIVKGLGDDVAATETKMGRLKTAGTTAFGSLSSLAGPALLGAGTAIAGFGVKAVLAFTDAAVAAGKMADATGLSVEAASKWTEVAGDVGVSAESIEKAVGKMSKTLGTSQASFDDAGVAIVRLADGTVDVNATFLNVIDVLNKTTDPARRAALGAKLLGKGWTDMAELVEQGAGALTKSLDEVSSAKIIDENELKKAREMRALIDSMKDKFEDFSLTVGGMGSDIIGPIADAFSALDSGLDKVESWVDVVRDPLVGLFKDTDEAVVNLAPHISLAAYEARKMGEAAAETSVDLAELAKAADDSARAFENQKQSAVLAGADTALAWRKSVDNLKETFADVKSTADEKFDGIYGTAKAFVANVKNEFAKKGMSLSLGEETQKMADAIKFLSANAPADVQAMVQQVIADLGALPTDVPIKVHLDDSEVYARLRALNSAINASGFHYVGGATIAPNTVAAAMTTYTRRNGPR